MYIRIYIYIQIYTLELGGWGPKAGNALQEVCVHEVGNNGGLGSARLWNDFFCLKRNCRACAWTGTTPGVFGRGRPRVLGRPSHPQKSYHPKNNVIGKYIHIYRHIPRNAI